MSTNASWVSASAAGALVGFWFLTAIIQRFLPFDLLYSLPGIILVRGAVIGTFLGYFQWRVLDRLNAGVDHWILRTGAAYVVSSSLIAAGTPLLTLLPLTTTGRYVLELPIVFTGGVVMGTIQSSGLGRIRIEGRSWMWAMGWGWTLGAVLPFVIPGLGQLGYFPNALTHGLWGLGVGLLTLYPLRKCLGASE